MADEYRIKMYGIVVLMSVFVYLLLGFALDGWNLCWIIIPASVIVTAFSDMISQKDDTASIVNLE